MAGYDVGGGGGRIPTLTENQRFSLAMPGEITDPASQVDLLNQMLRELYESHRLLYSTLETGGIISSTTGAASGGDGDVTGPSSSTADDIVTFNGATGKIIKDSGIAISTISALTGIELQYRTFSLTEAQLEAIVASDVSTYVEIAPAPGANKIILPLGWYLKLVVTVAYGNSPTMFPVYNASDIDASTFAVFPTGTAAFTTTGTKYLLSTGVGGTALGFSASVTAPVNLALMLGMSAALTGAGSATLTGRILYGVVDFS